MANCKQLSQLKGPAHLSWPCLRAAHLAASMHYEGVVCCTAAPRAPTLHHRASSNWQHPWPLLPAVYSGLYDAASPCLHLQSTGRSSKPTHGDTNSLPPLPATTPSPLLPLSRPSTFPPPTAQPLPPGLGVQVIVVVGAQQQIDSMLTERGMTPKYVGGYRLTDQKAMRIAIEAAGQIRTTCEQFLSKVRAVEGGGGWEPQSGKVTAPETITLRRARAVEGGGERMGTGRGSGGGVAGAVRAEEGSCERQVPGA